MPYGGPPEDAIGPTQGLAGGPGPSPRGVDDGTPHPGADGPETGLPEDEAQEDAERTAGGSGGGAARPRDTSVGGSEPDVAPEPTRKAGPGREGPER
jgi:hypothetical protein